MTTSDSSPSETRKLDDETEQAINAFGLASYNVGYESSVMWTRPVWTEKNLIARQADCAVALEALRQRIRSFSRIPPEEQL